MSKRRVVLVVLGMVILSALLIEGALRLIDPTGMYRYYSDYTDLAALTVPAPDGYRFVPGYHTFRQYHAVIGIDGLRGVPGSQFSDCSIVFAGDSVTFGMGADLSFVDVLAPELPAVTVNAGIPGYSAGNVARLIDTIPADGYVWLMIQNDDEPPYRWQRGAGALPSAFELYLARLFPGSGDRRMDEDGFTQYADTILAREDVRAFVFESQKLTALIQARYPQVTVIPLYTGHVSTFDAHPDAAGAAQIAASLKSAVMEFTQQQCQE